MKYIRMFSRSIIWIIPLKTLYNLNFECILWMSEWFSVVFVSFFFYVMFYLQRFRALEYLVIILLPCSFSLELKIEMIFFSCENFVVSVRRRKRSNKSIYFWLKHNTRRRGKCCFSEVCRPHSYQLCHLHTSITSITR